MNIDDQTSLNELLTIAKETVNEVKPNEEFIVKELFRGFEWNRISKGDRTKLGSMFYNYVQNEGSQQIKALGKTPQNQQKYEKK